jgi:FMN phosphatase YigB (HAD superfamily)
MYLGAAEHLSIPPNKVAMVASHVKDLRAAASYGLKTVYLRRIFEYDLEGKVIEEDESRVHEEFDVVVDSLLELVQIVEGTK